ncbi:hypothetical protein BCY84_18668 [Trypanosoma cruzi cruzi]|nr:hypothetical protein BCY84_18668 [Trypanosoma cruzi cruzi]
MAAAPQLISSLDVLRPQLKGVRAEHGALVSLRDAPAFEMVMRLNQRYKGKLVTAIMTQSSAHEAPKSDDDVQRNLNEANCSAMNFVRASEEKRLVFVPEAYEAFLGNEMQKWLDPFYGRNEANKSKRSRAERDMLSSDDEEFTGDGMEDDEYSSFSE